MEPSKHNIVSQIKGTNDFFVINILSGNADIISKEEAEMIQKNLDEGNKEFIEKGYIVNSKEEESLYKQKYLQFIDDRDNDEIQLFFVTNYSCNFACNYCYQDEYTTQKSVLTEESIDAFFNYINLNFSGRRKYITIFGGEPLLLSPRQQQHIKIILEKAKSQNIDCAIVTNGYNIMSYVDIFKHGNIREIQVTLDGTEEIHDKRRFLKNKNGTFNEIVEGIDSALQNGFPVNLRMVIDKENIDELPKLSRFAIEKGWTKNSLFKTQLGRNYELHHCQAENKRLFSRISMYEEIYSLIQDYPEILEFHKPAYSVAKFLWQEGELPDPLFDSCPGTKTEWAFDYTGKIYSCTATVGKTGEELGAFYPTIHFNEEKVEPWEERDVVSIGKCKDCAVQLACGGGCASVAKNTNGTILSPDCRPIKELLELGISLYFHEEQVEHIENKITYYERNKCSGI